MNINCCELCRNSSGGCLGCRCHQSTPPPDVPSEKKCCELCEKPETIPVLTIYGCDKCPCHIPSPQVGKREDTFYELTKTMDGQDRLKLKLLISTIESAAREEAMFSGTILGRVQERQRILAALPDARHLHGLYLAATKYLNPESYNPAAQKSFDELTDEQKKIDDYIISAIRALIKNL